MNIAFIGIGSMGLPMAKNLVKNGQIVYAYDIDSTRLEKIMKYGAIGSNNPKEAASKSELVITMLPESNDTKEAILGINGVIEGIKANTILIDMGTGSPSVTRELSSILEKKK